MEKFPPREQAAPGTAVTLPGLDLAGAEDLAGSLARALVPGDVILLNGPLATGKTALVAMVCAALDCRERVSSPTYTISHFYDTTDFAVHHIDTYRLEDRVAFDRLGLEEFQADSVTFIEWGERVASTYPAALSIDIAPGHDSPRTRNYRFSSSNPRWRRFIATLADGPGLQERTS